MTNCEQCGVGPLTQTQVPEYPCDRIGIDGVVAVAAVWEARCAACGHVGDIEIPNLPGLIAAVAVARIKLPDKLQGEELSGSLPRAHAR